MTAEYKRHVDDYSMKDEHMFTDRSPQRNVIPFHVAGESQASRTLLSLRLSDIGFEQSRTFLRPPSSTATIFINSTLVKAALSYLKHPSSRYA